MSDNKIILERWAEHPSHGTFGEVFHDGVPLCVTVERPWLGNRNNVSCIPSGVYELRKTTRSNGDEVYALVNEDLGVYRYAADRPNGEGRFAVLIHIANWMTDVEGCIGPGKAIAASTDRHGTHRMMVRSSSDATRDLFNYIEKHRITHIAIVWKEHHR